MVGKADENLLLTSTRFIKQKDYWTHKLSGNITGTELRGFINGNRNGDGARQKNPEVKEIPIPFSPGLCSSLLKLSKKSDLSIYIILLTGLKALIYRYTGNEDVIVGSPTYKPAVSHETINNVLFIRDIVDGDFTFKELLLKSRQSVLEAYNNQDYPFGKLWDYFVRISRLPEEMLLSDTVCLLKNIHSDNSFKQGAAAFSFERCEDQVKGSLVYDSHGGETFFIQRMIRHFTGIMETALQKPDTKISCISFLSGEEKKQLLVDFSGVNTGVDTGYRENNTLQQLFEAQVERTPDNILALYKDTQLTYRELNETANRLAWVLRSKGVRPDGIVGMVVAPSIEMITGIWGILKAGGAYLPIDCEYPGERMLSMLRDSNASILLTTGKIAKNLSFTLPGDSSGPKHRKSCPGNRLKIFIENKTGILAGGRRGNVTYREETGADLSAAGDAGKNPGNRNKPGDLAYIIFTSGSTGIPRGVMVEHRNVTAYLDAFAGEFRLTAGDTVIQQTSISFDAFVEEFFPISLQGGKIVPQSKYDMIDIFSITDFIVRHQVSLISCSPLLLNELNKLGSLDSIHTFISGGDVLKAQYINNLLKTGKVYNTYGPTETTVCATYYRIPPAAADNIPIGKPITHYNITITDKNHQLLPTGIPGELCISGPGVARGYLNRPGLTAEKFIPVSPGFYRSYRSYMSYIPKNLYKTGDLACWLPDGNIEFLGRVDSQVKIRGYRIEPKEIEKQLEKRAGIKKAVVITKDDNGDKCLCAYIVSADAAAVETGPGELREYLLDYLPDYMVPAFFTYLEEIPLTAGGKVDRNRLPSPGAGLMGEYNAPRDEVEEKLAQTWAEVLEIKKDIIGIDMNFFEMGGHSLKATVLVAKIYKELQVNVPMAEIFKNPSIRKMARYIKSTVKTRYTALEPVEEKEYYALSSAQKRLYVLQQQAPGSISYNMPQTILLGGDLQIEFLQHTFVQLIRRHESLRTSFHMVEDRPVQKIRPVVDFEIDERGKPGGEALETSNIETITRDFVRPFDLSCAPLLRVGLVRTGDKKYLLLVDMHHIISDGISMEILEKEFTAISQEKALSPLPLQYKDFSRWQNNLLGTGKISQQEVYWLKQFEMPPPPLNLLTDYPKPKLRSFEAGVISFEIDRDHSEGLKKMAREENITLFMIMMTIYIIFLSKITQQQDIVMGTPLAGRRHPDLEQIIGMFVNILPLRTRPGEHKTFKTFLREVKEGMLDVFENQDYPFEELVEKVAGNRDNDRNPLFDTVFTFDTFNQASSEVPGKETPDLEPFSPGQDYMKRMLKFDMLCFGQDQGKNISFSFQYGTDLFKQSTLERYGKYFKEIAANVVRDGDIGLKDIDISLDILKPDGSILQEDTGDFGF